MTGHIGARTNRAVAMVTDDFRVYHQVAPYLEERGVIVLGLRPGEAVPPSVQVLIGGPRDDDRTIALHDDLDVLWLELMVALVGKRTAVIGVDPGKTFGLAVVAGDTVYDVAEAADPEDAAMRVLRWANALECSVHVGDGAPEMGKAFMRILARRGRVPAMMVGEAGSSHGPVQTLSRHTDAAVRIAMRRSA